MDRKERGGGQKERCLIFCSSPEAAKPHCKTLGIKEILHRIDFLCKLLMHWLLDTPYRQKLPANFATKSVYRVWGGSVGTVGLPGRLRLA